MQRRGKGSKTYRVNKRAYLFKLQYPPRLGGEGTVIELLNSKCHTAPLAKVQYSKDSKKDYFYIPAFDGMFEGQKITFSGTKLENGNIMRLVDIPVKTPIYCIESRPGDGGKLIKTAGSSAEISRVTGETVWILMPSKKERAFNKNCRAVVGTIAGAGRLDKPIVKAGKQHFIKKARNKLWPRTSACKMNAIDHPFGSGRGKVAKSRIAKRNAPAGARVGLIRPKRTGKRK